MTSAQTNQEDARVDALPLASPPPAAVAHTSLTYHLRNRSGHPLSGISVEVRKLQTHSVIASALTGVSGDVKFYDLLPGRYEITVAGGILPPRREVQLNGGSTQAVLEVPLSEPNGHETVSVGELTVSRQARDALNTATEAWQKKDWGKARTQAMRALTMHPDYAAALALLGYLDLQDGKPELACTDLTRAIDSDPNSALAYLTLGSAYNSMKLYEEALQALSVFRSVSADNWLLHYERARSYIGLGKYELGLLEINDSQKLAEQDPAVLRLAKAHALAGLRRNSEAVAELETLLRKGPKGPYASDAQTFLALLRSQKKQ